MSSRGKKELPMYRRGKEKNCDCPCPRLVEGKERITHVLVCIGEGKENIAHV